MPLKISMHRLAAGRARWQVRALGARRHRPPRRYANAPCDLVRMTKCSNRCSLTIKLFRASLHHCQDTETSLMPSCCHPTEDPQAFGFKSRLRGMASELSDGAKGFTTCKNRRGTSHILAPLNILTTGPSIRKCLPTVTEGFAEPLRVSISFNTSFRSR